MKYVLLLALLSQGPAVVIAPFSVSAYDDSSGSPPWGLTASGVLTGPHVVACGPSYPFGTLIYIEERWYVCLDRGRAITDGHLDIWKPSQEEALQWGRRELLVMVVVPSAEFLSEMNLAALIETIEFADSTSGSLMTDYRVMESLSRDPSY